MFDIFRLETRKIVTNDWFAFVVSWNKSDKEKKKIFFSMSVVSSKKTAQVARQSNK